MAKYRKEMSVKMHSLIKGKQDHVVDAVITKDWQWIYEVFFSPVPPYVNPSAFQNFTKYWVKNIVRNIA